LREEFVCVLARFHLLLLKLNNPVVAMESGKKWLSITAWLCAQVHDLRFFISFILSSAHIFI